MADRQIQAWEEISLADLFYAFRKAKVDCFYESSLRVTERFVRYEEDIASNLVALMARLHRGEIADVLREGMGQPIVLPKKLHIAVDDGDTRKAHAFFSDSNRAFKRASSHSIRSEFRLIGDFSVDCHVISALWINLVGHKYDALLSPRALASRVRRYRSSKDADRLGEYHLEALGSFEPYFTPYRRWRDDGLLAMKESVARGEAVIALTLDVGNFYHSVDPRFFVEPLFLEFLGLSLSRFELSFSKSISEFLVEWSQRCADTLKLLGCTSIPKTGGIPIGLSVVRVISNAVLSYLDQQIEKSLSPIYYARYVDDLFLVIRDDSEIESQEGLWELIRSRIPAFSRNSNTGDVSLQLPEWGGSSRIRLQGQKQKAFFLSGRSGLDLLANIASQIREVSSERRLMPLPETLDQTASAKTLSATDSPDEADSLRRADGLTLRRLGWSVLLRSVNTLARDLRAADWEAERDGFYQFAHEHVIRPDRILEQLDHLPRLFSLAVSLSDWKQAARMLNETISAIYKLQEATNGRPMRINGHDAKRTTEEVWERTRHQVRVFFQEALIRAYPLEAGTPKLRAFTTILKQLEVGRDQLKTLALMCREMDWSRVPYRHHIREQAIRQTPRREHEELLYARYPYEGLLRQFLSRTEQPTKVGLPARVAASASSGEAQELSLLPFLFPTRPYTPEEIALYLPGECVFGEPAEVAVNWAEYTRAVRGVWVRSALAEDFDGEGELPSLPGEDGAAVGPPAPGPIYLGDGVPSRPIRLGVTSFATSDHTWSLGASGTPDLSPSRYRALAKIVNQAVNETYRPDYLVLPELSVPEKWIPTISGRLIDANIGLIAGLDYRLHPGNEIDSSAVLVLTDKRLGYPSSLQVRQRKELPAPGEEELLYVNYGKTWRLRESVTKPVYVHNGMHFGILVCSELQNIDYRKSFQGNVDLLLILSWNRDIETFSALVDSAGFDVHAYIALVNNLRYGDSRVRCPAKQSHLRDLCRVRGGLNNQLVVVQIDPANLRAQQSRSKSWPRPDDHYKPTPEGFRVSPSRTTLPS